MIKAPSFWLKKTFLSFALLPLSWLWQGLSMARSALIKPESALLPVICVGNISVGGTGKTPLTAGLCQLLKDEGWHPSVLTRGYGGTAKGPVFADPNIHNASEIGDEALMLSMNDMVCVSRDRVSGARFIAQNSKADIIIMDDGMQNVWLKKDFTLLVFDGEIGLANNRIVPSGPLRQSLASGLKSADIVVFNGPDKTGLQDRIGDAVTCLHTKLIVNPVTAAELKGKTVLGFAGIGRPERFFETLRDTGANVLHTRPFADHHPYSDADMTRLYMEAGQLGAQLVTTQKDWVRLPPEWRERILAMDVSIELGREQSEMLLSRINAVLAEKKS